LINIDDKLCPFISERGSCTYVIKAKVVSCYGKIQ